MIFCLYFKDIIRQTDDVFEIKMKYHNFIVILLILTHILSYQDGIIVRSFFLPLFPKIVGWFWILEKLIGEFQCAVSYKPFPQRNLIPTTPNREHAA